MQQNPQQACNIPATFPASPTRLARPTSACPDQVGSVPVCDPADRPLFTLHTTNKKIIFLPVTTRYQALSRAAFCAPNSTRNQELKTPPMRHYPTEPDGPRRTVADEVTRRTASRPKLETRNQELRTLRHAALSDTTRQAPANRSRRSDEADRLPPHFSCHFSL
jgi:hypothetical protein